MLRDEITEYYRSFRITRDLIELRNISLAGELIIESAARRKESRGLHFTVDYPTLNPKLAEDTVLCKRELSSPDSH